MPTAHSRNQSAKKPIQLRVDDRLLNDIDAMRRIDPAIPSRASLILRIVRSAVSAVEAAAPR